MASGAPPGPSAPPPDASSQPVPLSWEGDRMFNIYIYDYCHKRGYVKTARELVSEADIPADSQPPINAKQGLLFEWWSVFWVLFQAKNSGNGSEDALTYTQHQNSQRIAAAAQAQRQAQAGPQQRFPPPPPMNGIQRQPGPPPPGSMPNGVGPGGQASLQPGPPSGYPLGTSGAQTNGMPGPPGGQPQNFQPQSQGQRPLGPQQRGPNGTSQFQSPTMAPSPQSQGGQQQPQNGPMGQLGRSPHMSNVNRGGGMHPPNQMGAPMQMSGSAQQTPTQGFQQAGRPPSRQDTPSMQHSMNPNPSPSLMARAPPGERERMQADLNSEWSSYSPDIMQHARVEAGLGDKDPGAFTLEETQRAVMAARRIRSIKPPPNAVAGPSTINMMQPPHNQRNPQQQSQQQQMQAQQQRGAKRNSTSPGEEHETLPRNESSPPDRKRPRRTPVPAEQQQPPMAPMGGPFPPPPQQGGPGPGPNGNMMRGPMSGQQMGGFAPQGMPHMGGQPGMGMQQQMQSMAPMHMANSMSPSMMNRPPPMMPQQMGQPQAPMYVRDPAAYRNMHGMHQKSMPNSVGSMMPVGPGTPSSNDPQAHMRGPPGQPGPSSRMQQQQKGMGMLPPGQPSMAGPNKPPQSGGKDNGGGDLGGPGGLQGNEQQEQRGPGLGQGPPHSINPSQAGNGPTTPASGPPSNMPTPSPSAILSMNNPQRPPTASAPAPPPPSADAFFAPDFLSSLSTSGLEDFDPSSLMTQDFDQMDFWMAHDPPIDSMK